jgi:hypothetical protein
VNPSIKPSAASSRVRKQDIPAEAPQVRGRGWVIGLLALLVLVMFGSVLFATKDLVPGAPDTDLALQYVHLRAFGFGELAKGHLPLWNPHLYSGVPFLGGFQAALLYPPNMVFLVLPLAKAVSWSVALHVFLFGAFTFWWVSRRGVHPWAAFLAAVTMMFCGPHFLHVYGGHLTHLCTMTWSPLVFVAVDGLLEGRNALRWQLLGMFAVAMQVFAGYPQYVYFIGVAAVMYALCCAVRLPKRTRFLIGVASIYIGGALLGAAQLFTGFDDWREMSRGSGIPYEACVSFSMPPENLLTAFAPGLFGDVAHSTYWGRRYLWEASVFVGVVALCLAVIGATADKKVRRFSLTMFFVFLLLALGGYTPVYKVLFYALPMLNKFRTPAKWALPATLYIALLAGIGLNELLRGRRLSRNVVAAVGVFGLGLFGCAAAIYVSGHDGSVTSMWHSLVTAVSNTHESYLDATTYNGSSFIVQSSIAAARSLAIAAVTFVCVAVLLEWHRRGASTRPLMLLVALACVESCYLASRTFDSFSVAANRSATLKRIVESDAGDYRILNLDSPNEAMVTGARDIWGYDAAIPARYSQVLALTQGLPPDLFPSYVDVTNTTSPLLAMFRCKYVIPEKGSKQPVQTLSNALPHVLLVPNYRVVPNRETMFGTLLHPAFNPRAEVLLESSPAKFSLQPAMGPPSDETPQPGTVKIESETTDTLTIEADVKSAAVLLVTDTYARNWRALSLPGSSQHQYELMPANHCLRAVPLEAGHHRLKMDYVPMGFEIGKWVSLASGLIFFGCVVWCVMPLRRKSVSPGL